MRKPRFTSVVIFLSFVNICTAQHSAVNNTVFGNQSYLNNNTSRSLAFQDNKKNILSIMPDAAARDAMKANELATYQAWAKPLVASTGNDYDVKYYRLELRINPDTSIGKYVRGKVTTYFKTTLPNFSVLNFDFATPLTCDSVYYHGVKLATAFVSEATTDLLKITIPNLPSAGTLDSVSVWYRGVPPAVAGFSNGTGFVKAKHNSNANNYVYTLSEPYSSYTWWPCKSFVVSDKADSMDMIVSTPTSFKVAGNGTLVSETTSGPNIFTYWKERYPIAAYQVCTAVANYVQYPATADTVIIGGTKMPVYNYLFPETNTTASHTSLDRVKLMLTTFSSLFGDYPFKNEKYGNYSFGFGGGMEHNTFSGESNVGVYDQAQYWDILAHELGHQWWGDNVTCGSWQNIWVNESFADYSEVLCAEFAPSTASAAGQTGLSWRQGKKNLAINTANQAQSTFVTDTSTITTIFTPAVYIYERGGMIISMLRTLLGDAKFFQALKNYQADPLLKYGSGVTADVQRHMEAVSGLDLSVYFSQWIYNKGFAEYNNAAWNNNGNQVIFRLPQTTNSSALPHFDMPLAIRIQGSSSGDTTVIVYDKNGVINYDNNGVLTSTGSNMVQYTLSFVPSTITFDALSQTLANGAFAKDASLKVLSVNATGLSVKRQEKTAMLSWNTDKEDGFASFEIQKSTDGVLFVTIGVADANRLVNQRSFGFTDHTLFEGVNYYRIKTNQQNGTETFSKIVSVLYKNSNAPYTISPNPAASYVLIRNNNVSEKADIKIVDASGKLVQKIDQQLLPGYGDVKIDVHQLPSGTYFLKIGSKGKTFLKPIMVTR